MRNLKRALSMALASVMVLGLTVVGAGAAGYQDFTDADEIQHTEAVSMITELGILAGLPDGSFGATQNIDRASFARLVCVVLNGGKEPILGNLTTDFTDTQGNWAEAYIAFCVNRGIIAGRGDGTFGPSDNVTGSEAAKMLLVALGYNAEYEGIGGSTWEITTNSLANLAGLYEGLETINPSEPLTRDNAAQMIYNVLNANVVSYNWTFNTNGNTVAVQDKSDETLLENAFGVVIVEGVVTANEFASLGTNSSMDEGETRIVVTNHDDGQTNYTNGAQTFQVSTGEDVLGRSVALYVQPSTTASSSASRATVLGNVVVSSDNTVVTDLSSDSIAEVAEDNDLSLVETTENVTGTTYTFNYDDPSSDSGASADKDAVDAIVGQGVEKTLIDNDDDGVAEYVFVNRFDLGKVTRYSTDGDGAIVVRTNSSSDEYERADVIGFDDVTRNDYVLTAEIGGKLYVELPETVTGTLELYRTSDGQTTRLTVDGTEYYVSTEALVHSDLEEADSYGSDNLDSEATFYLDRNGYIIAVGDVEESAYSYAYVVGKATGNDLDADRVRVTLPDGTTTTYDLDDSGSYLDIGAVTKGSVYRYSINSDGEIRLSTAYPINVELAAGEFENGRAGVTVDGETYYTTANTLFFYSDDEADAETGAYSDVDVYTGYNNAPTTEGQMQVWRDSSNRIVAVTVVGGTGKIAADDSLFIYHLGNRNNDYVIADVVLAGSDEVTEGVRVTLDEGVTPAEDELYMYTVNSDGEYVLTATNDEDVTEEGISVVEGTVVDVYSGSFTLMVEDESTEYGMSSDTVVVDDVDDPSTPAVEVGSGFSEDDIVTVLLNDDNDAVMVIITGVAQGE
ncbi:MAG TPA: S-layer homology domain-containing protein [Candidatus Flavonifractor intestinipullorum]|uniref:S-layer homology domain-containing protein n=1 Tax=Candidatus Flavonifractor intestinipullorum TaxID=2838587 RepID=A0A9D2MCM9_9FIRM|nr:S-layer homology domain-containing protein [Candidatus Flavonifractor intestinipullorum]